MTNHFFDIGANCGNTFDLFLNQTQKYHGWKVWCFEPSPKHMNNLLNKAIQVSNKFNVVVCPFGLSGKTEVVPFYEMVNNTVSDSFIQSGLYATLDPDPKYNIIGSCVSICDFIEKYTTEFDNVVLKVDCEGSEFGIYESLLNRPDIVKRISKVYNEWHPSYGHMTPDKQNKVKNITIGFEQHKIEFAEWSF